MGAEAIKALLENMDLDAGAESRGGAVSFLRMDSVHATYVDRQYDINI
jgi:hypothetical protein